MDVTALGWLPIEQLAAMAGTLNGDVLAAAVFFLGTAALVALCVPGIVLPMAVTSGALLGTWPAVAAVALGALAGSLMLFTVGRRLARDRLRHRLGNHLQRFERQFATHGIWYVFGLRLIGAPHFLVTAGSALMPIKATAFAAATLLGLLPVIALAAATGSMI